MAQGTLDVTTGLQKRTNPSKIDRLLMVNPETAEPQYIEMDQVTGQVRGDMLPAFDLDNARVMTSTAPDNKVIKSNVLEPLTGRYVTFREYTGITPIVDGTIFINHGGKTYKRTDKEYYIESFGVLGVGNDSTVFQKALDGIAQTESKRLIIDGYSLSLTTEVNKTISGAIIEFRNGAKITQPIQPSIITQARLLTIIGDKNTFINLYTDGNFTIEGLNNTGPTPKGTLCRIQGYGTRLLGDTICVNSSGYNLDLYGDDNFVEKLHVKNNGYSGFRWTPLADSRKFEIGSCEATQIVGPRARKSGVTINGQFYVDLIKIGSYKGHNAAFFTEAVVESGSTGVPYYKKVVIDTLDIYLDQDLQYPDGSPAANSSGKMENAQNIIINDFRCFTANPSGAGQGYWFNEAENVKIGAVTTNAGLWKMPKNFDVDVFKYVYTGNNIDAILDFNNSGIRVANINHFIHNIPEGVTPSINGIGLLTSEAQLEIKKHTASNGVFLGLVRATPFLLKGQVRSPKGPNIGTANSAFRQSIDIPFNYVEVSLPTSITRDVSIGEVFVFITEASVHKMWIVKTSGTSSWSGNTFTGTATFHKVIANGPHGTNARNNIATFLTPSDVGVTVVSTEPGFYYWNGSEWSKTYPLISVSANTASASSGATPTKAEFDDLLTELRDLKTKMRTAGLLAS